MMIKIFSKKILIGIVSLMPLIFLNCSENTIHPVKSMVVGDQDDGQKEFAGKVDENKSVKLSFKDSGTIIKFDAKDGHTYKKGHLLAKLNAADLEKTLEKAKSQRDQAKAILTRTKDLYKRRAVKKSELLIRERNYTAADNKYKTVLAKLNQSKIFAPYYGKVIKKYVSLRNRIKAGQPILLFEDMTKIDITAEVLDTDVALLKEKTDISLSAKFDSDKEYKVKIGKYLPKSDANTPTTPVTFTLSPVAGLNPKSGDTATVIASFDSSKAKPNKDSFLIPESAILTDVNGAKSVWLVDETSMTVKQMTVKIGQAYGDQVLIEQGLNTGDRIVTAGAHLLEDGAKIRLLTDPM